MSLVMTKQEREAFLADVHVGIISISDEGRAPFRGAIWYAYDPGGDLRIMTGKTAAAKPIDLAGAREMD